MERLVFWRWLTASDERISVYLARAERRLLEDFDLQLFAEASAREFQRDFDAARERERLLRLRRMRS